MVPSSNIRQGFTSLDVTSLGFVARPNQPSINTPRRPRIGLVSITPYRAITTAVRLAGRVAIDSGGSFFGKSISGSTVARRR